MKEALKHGSSSSVDSRFHARDQQRATESASTPIICLAMLINTFKDRSDKLWSHRDVLYDYKSDLHGIGNRIVL